MNVTIRVIAGLVGLVMQLAVLDAAVRTFLLPRVARVRLSRWVALLVGLFFRALTHFATTYPRRDRILSLYASIILLSYQALWLTMSLVAFALGFFAAGAPTAATALTLSGSSLLTLGTTPAVGAAANVLQFVEAGVGLTLLALLIAFIPPLYSAFQRREISVSRLSVRAGIPATPWGILEIAQSVESYDRLDELWREWEAWFVELGETHTTLTILNFYRSPDPNQTWIGCAAAILDAAALFNSAIDLAPSPSAGLCIRSGWLTLRRLADYFQVDYPTTLSRTAHVSITREEFDLVLDRLGRSGLPLIGDRDAAWADFVGWRVNYDAIVESFYVLFSCPRTDWRAASVQPLVGRSNQRGG